MTIRGRLGRLLLAVALLLAVVIAGAAGHARYRRTHFPLVVIETGMNDESHVSFLDDGRLLLVVGKDQKRAEVYSATTGEHVRTLEDPASNGRRAYAEVAARAPLVAFQDWVSGAPLKRVVIRLVSATTGASLGELDAETGLNWDVLSARGNRIALDFPGRRVVVHDTGTRAVVRSIAEDPNETWFFEALSPEGDRVAFVRGDPPRIRILDLAAESSACVVSGRCAVFLEERDEFVVFTPQETLEVHARDGRVLTTLPCHSTHGAEFVTAGSVYACFDPDSGPFEVRSCETGELKRRLPRTEDVRALLLASSDRAALVYRDGHVEIWEIPP
jgi:hypothetical protein